MTMNKFALVILAFYSYIPFQAQVIFPSEIKGNWLKATDSIEWYCSFQPKFAVLDMQFWNYKVLNRNAKSYRNSFIK